MTRSLRVAGAQLNLRVGDIDGNVVRIADTIDWATEAGADVVVFPELAVTGYPPEDLVLRDGFVQANLDAVTELAKRTTTTAAVVGFVDRLDQARKDDDAVLRGVANAAAVLFGGRVVDVYHKQLLPNYGVFDEARIFAEGNEPVRLHTLAGVQCGVSICEDLWDESGPPTGQALGGAEVLLNINGSPYHLFKRAQRKDLLSTRATELGAYVVYVNTVGGQDELVFDGGSTIVAPDGSIVVRLREFVEDRFVVDLPIGAPVSPLLPTQDVVPLRDTRPTIDPPEVAPEPDELGEVYEALVTGLRDYVVNNGFSEVVVGLSGGIDSALTAAIAADALGGNAVHGITMPTRYSSPGSVDDSVDLAERLGARLDLVPIDDLFGAFLETLGPLFEGQAENVAEENLQSRIRGTILMAVSNKYGGMVVATGNKSEMAVGYATLYGDMAGGYAVLKDVYKTMVYDLSRWRNETEPVIPQAIIDKEPSAELRPDQLDTDSLPPYDVLDDVLFRYIELDMTASEIAAAGVDADLARRVATLVDRNEYKRRQAPPGVKITSKAFGRDRRLPITNRFRP